MSTTLLHAQSVLGAKLSEELVEASDVDPHDSVTIAGSRHLDLLAVLCRRGIAEACCQASHAGAVMLSRPSTVLLLPNIATAGQLTDALAGTRRNLAPGCRIVVRLAHWLASRRVDSFRQILAENGFALSERRASLADGSMLLFATRAAVAAVATAVAAQAKAA